MNVAELIEELEGMPPEAEVRIAHQPSWPFEYSLSSIVEVGGETPPAPDAQDYATEEDYEDALAEYEDDDAPEELVVYIAEGSQLGYLPGAASRELGWK